MYHNSYPRISQDRLWKRLGIVLQKAENGDIRSLTVEDRHNHASSRNQTLKIKKFNIQ